MDELDRFRDFRSGVEAPSEDGRQRAVTLLATAIEREPTPVTSVLRRLGKRRYAALALGALVGAIATALFVSTPWHNSPGFLERAQAAVTSPADTVLHMKWESGSTSTDPTCMFTRGPHETWIDQTPPHKFRVITHVSAYFPTESDECLFAGVTRDEIGGDLDSGLELWFVPPDTLAVWPLGTGGLPPDPVEELREAISAGRAHHEGRTQLDGSIVERIRIDPSADCSSCPPEPGYAYVDPETFYLVRREGPGEIARAGGPVVGYAIVERFLTFEYLPRTAANIALTDIQAQHPNVTP